MTDKIKRERVGRRFDGDVAGEGGLVDAGAGGGPVVFPGADMESLRTGNSGGHGELPAAGHHAVGGGPVGAIEAEFDSGREAIGIFHGDHGVAPESGSVGDSRDLQIRAAAVDIDDFGKGLEKGWKSVFALIENTGFDGVETFGEAGDIRRETPVARGNLCGTLEATADDTATGVVKVCDGVGVGCGVALAPFDHDAIGGDSGRRGEMDIDIHGVGGDARKLARLAIGQATARHDPGHGFDCGTACIEADGFGADRSFGHDRGIGHIATALDGGGDIDKDPSVIADGDVAGIAGVIFEHGAGLEGGLDCAAVVATGRAECDKKQPFAGQWRRGADRPLVALERIEVAFGPTLPLVPAGEVVFDVNEIGDAVHAVIAQRAGVAGEHPGFDLALVVREVVAGGVNNGNTDPGEDVGVTQLASERRGFIVALDKHDALGGAEAGERAEGGQITIVEGRPDHLAFTREIYVAEFITEISPVIDLALAADEELGKNQCTIATAEVVLIKFVDIGVVVETPTAFVAELQFVVETPTGLAEEIGDDMLGRIEPGTIVVHRIAQPVDPAAKKLHRMLAGKCLSWVVEGVEIELAGLANEKVGHRVAARVGEPVVALGDDVDEANEFLLEGETPAVVNIAPGVHALGAAEPAGLVLIPPTMEIVRSHSRVGPEVRTVAGMVHNDVGVDFDIGLVGGIDHLAQMTPRAVSCGPIAALGDIAKVEAVEEAVAHIAATGKHAARDRRLGGRGMPDAAVADLGDFREAAVDFIPLGFEILEDDFGVDRPRGEDDAEGQQGKEEFAHGRLGRVGV